MGLTGSGDAAGLCWRLQETNQPCLCIPRPVVFLMTCPDRPAAAPAKPPCSAQWMTGPHQQHANDPKRGRRVGEGRVGGKERERGGGMWKDSKRKTETKRKVGMKQNRLVPLLRTRQYEAIKAQLAGRFLAFMLQHMRTANMFFN